MKQSKTSQQTLSAHTPAVAPPPLASDVPVAPAFAEPAAPAVAGALEPPDEAEALAPAPALPATVPLPAPPALWAALTGAVAPDPARAAGEATTEPVLVFGAAEPAAVAG